MNYPGASSEEFSSIKRDIMGVSSMKIALPESGDVPLVDGSIVTGRDFHLALNPDSAIER